LARSWNHHFKHFMNSSNQIKNNILHCGICIFVIVWQLWSELGIMLITSVSQILPQDKGFLPLITIKIFWVVKWRIFQFLDNNSEIKKIHFPFLRKGQSLIGNSITGSFLN
jgi:hypothetical protein